MALSCSAVFACAPQSGQPASGPSVSLFGEVVSVQIGVSPCTITVSQMTTLCKLCNSYTVCLAGDVLRASTANNPACWVETYMFSMP